MSGPPTFRERLRLGGRRGARACLVLFRVTIPTFIVMELLRRAGAIDSIGAACAPLMSIFRLPGEAAIPFLLAYLVNMYTGAAALGTLGLGSGQVLTLGLMLGMAHTLPVETVVLRTAEARVGRLLVYRVVMSIVVGWIASHVFVPAGR